MTPKTDDVLLNSIENVQEQTSKTYFINTEKNTISGFCDGIEAMKQAIYCILNTERFEHLIYSWNYGIELKHLIGENSSFVIPELERVISEALLQDDRVSEVKNFEYQIEGNKLSVSFTVITTVGEIESKKVVSI